MRFHSGVISPNKARSLFHLLCWQAVLAGRFGFFLRQYDGQIFGDRMFDFGWQEFVMVAFVLVLVVGPKDLPKVLRGFTKFTRQARQMANEFTRSLEDVAADNNISDVKSMVADLKSGNLEDMARIVDDKEVTSELSKIKDNLDVAGLKGEVSEVQKAGQEEAAIATGKPAAKAQKKAQKAVQKTAQKAPNKAAKKPTKSRKGKGGA
jgi:sec-independent protein translocase protein TatB